MDERVEAILNNLTSLIVSHGKMLASEVYGPRRDPDSSDAFCKEEELWVRELRAIRTRFENLVLGIDDKEKNASNKSAI